VIWLVIGSVVPSFLISLCVAVWVRRRAASWGLIDRPDGRKAHSDPTPMGGGIAIWAGVVGALLAGQIALIAISHSELSGPPGADNVSPSAFARSSLGQFVAPHIAGLDAQSGKLWISLGAATILMVLGLIDDRRGLDWRLRLGVQTLIAVAMVAFGWRLSLFIQSPLLTGALSVLWIVGLINTFNMLDNMDGLSAGVAAIVAAILAAVILTAPDPVTKGPQLFVGGFLLVLVGSLLGFLWHNRPPARIFMGDAGSYFVGFCIAVATISATFAGEGLPRHAILAPLCVLAVPLYDTVTVVWIRIRERRSPFAADRNHLSHRLVDLGLSPSGAVLVIYAATAVCGAGAFLLHRVGGLGAAGILALIGAVLLAVAIVELNTRRRRQSESGSTAGNE
jgi:UDP-GlcNAc:undecaprenyl-phosphate GlcNAc-1-phosphate transferase